VKEMTALQQISQIKTSRDISLPRIDARQCAPAEFASRYGIPALPAVVSNLFEGQRISGLDQLTARREFGHLRVAYFPQYSSAWSSFLTRFHQGESLAAKKQPWAKGRKPRQNAAKAASGAEDAPVKVELFGETTLADYLDGKLPEQCYLHEIETPAEIKALYRWSEYCDPALYPWSGAHAERHHSPELMFIAQRGRHADLHCHHDINHVLLHQVFGRKTVVLLPPEASSKLFAITHASNLDLSVLGPAELEHFVRYAGGFIDLISPGETLFIPATWWHYLYYDDTAMSVNFRFAPAADQDMRFVSEMSGDPRHKRVAFALRDPALLAKYRPRIQQLRKRVASPFAGAHRKHRAAAQLMQEMFAELFPHESGAAHLDPNDLFSSLAAWRIGASMPRMLLAEVCRRVGYRLVRLG
jgi:hypothetical protein